MIWAFVLFAALMIPLTAVVLDSPAFQAWAGRRRGVQDGLDPSLAKNLQALEDKVETLESELGAANREIAQLKESQQFFQRLLEDPSARQAEAAARQAAARLPKPQP